MKMYVNKKELNQEEIRTGRVSYRRVIKKYIEGLVLCNNIDGLDISIWENINSVIEEDTEIYQYYLCNLSDYEKEKLIEAGMILSYSDMLECDVLMVDHYGTSWDYVMTDVEWSENLEECDL